MVVPEHVRQFPHVGAKRINEATGLAPEVSQWLTAQANDSEKAMIACHSSMLNPEAVRSAVAGILRRRAEHLRDGYSDAPSQLTAADEAWLKYGRHDATHLAAKRISAACGVASTAVALWLAGFATDDERAMLANDIDILDDDLVRETTANILTRLANSASPAEALVD